MSKLFSRIAGYLSNRTLTGVDKTGNRYFARTEEVDGVMKEKRWVIFKGEDDPTSIPAQKAPTQEEMEVLEAKRERLRQNVALLKKEEEERKQKEGGTRKSTSMGKAAGPDLRSFIRQFPGSSEGDKIEEETDAAEGMRDHTKREAEKERRVPRSSEPTGSGATYQPGTWQPPT